MSNLQKIKDLAASVKSSLASLTVKPDNLENIDSITQQRVALREKLAVLNDAEVAESKRLEAEIVAAKAKQRSVLLLGIAEEADNLATQYQEHTEHVVKLVEQIMTVLVKREQIFNTELLRLNDSETHDLLTLEERGKLIAQLDRTVISIHPDQFSTLWKNAVHQHCGDNHKLSSVLSRLVNPIQNDNFQLTNSKPCLADAARHLNEQITM